MLDIDKFDDLDLVFNKHEVALHKELNRVFSKTSVNNIPIPGELHINSRLIDVAKYYRSLENFEKEYNERKIISPNWEVTLIKWIEEIEQTTLGYKNIHFYDDTSTNSYNNELNNPLAVRAFEDITKGNNEYIYKYSKALTEVGESVEYIRIWDLKNIGIGVALAYKLPKLKEELKQLKDFAPITPVDITPIKQKIKWTGTPAQFGFLFDLLIQGGYIEKPTGSYTKDAGYFLEFFDIDTTVGTLAKELSEKTNSIETKYRNNVKIPPTDKLSKSESFPKADRK